MKTKKLIETAKTCVNKCYGCRLEHRGDCPYSHIEGCVDSLIADLVSKIEELSKKKVANLIKLDDNDGNGSYYVCSYCDAEIRGGFKFYCPCCGRELKELGGNDDK